MTLTLLLNEQEFKDLTPPSNQVNKELIVKKIIDAQYQYLRPILGCDLFDELLLQKSTNTLTPDNLILMDELKLTLANYSLYLYLPWSRIAIREQGTITKSGEYGSVVDQPDLKDLRADTMANATNYRIILQRFLCLNSTLYPLYKHCSECGSGCTISNVKSIKGGNTFFSV